MKEFKYIIASQALAIIFLSGIALGSLISQIKLIHIPPIKFASQDEVIKMAMKYHGTCGAYHENETWYFVDKTGMPCKLFTEKEK